MKLRNAIVIVTGASSGIGAATALELAKSGMRLALLARTQSKLEALATQLRALGAEAFVYPMDLSDQAGRLERSRTNLSRLRDARRDRSRRRIGPLVVAQETPPARSARDAVLTVHGRIVAHASVPAGNARARFGPDCFCRLADCLDAVARCERLCRFTLGLARIVRGPARRSGPNQHRRDHDRAPVRSAARISSTILA